MPGTYPPDWPDIANRIKADARWRCEHCGHPHEAGTGHVLTVHHLDGNKSNCDWRNLVALCQRCHLHIQGTWRPGQLWLCDAPRWAIVRGWAVGPTWVCRLDELTPVDHELLRAIRSSTGSDGAAHSLFDVAVNTAGLDYTWAHHRLRVLEALGYVRVERSGGGRPLVMRLVGRAVESRFGAYPFVFGWPLP